MMMQSLIKHLQSSLAGNTFWGPFLASTDLEAISLHLAIFQEPYLRYIFEGRKTIETRFAKYACAPYKKVNVGDILLLKRSGSPVTGLCRVDQVWFYQLQPDSLEFIRTKFGKAICPHDESFWVERRQAVYATLMKISDVAPIEKLPIPKQDRRGWVVLPTSTQQQLPF